MQGLKAVVNASSGGGGGGLKTVHSKYSLLEEVRPTPSPGGNSWVEYTVQDGHAAYQWLNVRWEQLLGGGIAWLLCFDGRLIHIAFSCLRWW